MRRISPPETGAFDALNACIGSIRDADLKERLRGISAQVVTAEDQYRAHGLLATLHLIEGTDGVAGTVTTAEMERLYKNTFVKSKATRDLYGAIKSAPENDICPLCSQRTVSQLDHYLPQSAHPVLSVTPVNLVPACSECNKTKLAIQAAVAEDQTFHPYFEDADDDRWLFASVVETVPAALVFKPQAPEHWEPVKGQRISAHFKMFGLAELYSAHAAVELNDIRFGLLRMSLRNTPEEIREHLQEVAASRAVAHANSWRRATYEALADSAWYCEGGFR